MKLTPFRVFVASPGDLTAEREGIKEMEKELRDDAEHAGYALRICDWGDVGPGLGRPQGIIFSQLPPEEWDVFIGLLWQRFGSPSGAANPTTGQQFESGTEEEFYEALRLHRDNSNRPYLLPYRCVRAVPPTANLKQLAAVQQFFERFNVGQPTEALVGQFKSVRELRTKVSADLRRRFRAGGRSAAKDLGVHTPGALVSSIDEADYRAHIRKHFLHLQLEALGGDQVYRDIDLQQVFIPQDARDCREWLPETLEGPGDLTFDAAAYLKLAELQENKRFRDTPPRPVLELLGDPQYHYRVLLGAPGAGKSSLTRIRLLEWATESAQRELPILVELRRFHRSGHDDFLEYLEGDKDLVFRFRTADLRTRLEAGTAELLFDGLDEIFDPVARESAARQIARYAESFKAARILVTSRLIGYPGRILRDAGFAHWLLADFEAAKITAFLEHWIAGAIREPSDRPIVRQRMEDALRNPVIRELAGNPLLLTLMAVLARESDLPRDLGSLYKQAADLLLKQWDARRYLATRVELGAVTIDQKDKHDLLRDLAWKMQTSANTALRGNLISVEEVKSAMDSAFGHRIPDPGLRREAIERLIEQLIERNYIICHVGGAQFAFVHRGFLEFFASDYLVHILATKPETALSEIGEIYASHVREDAWREVLILAATRFEPLVAEKILLPLVGSPKEFADESLAVTQGRLCVIEDKPHPFNLACEVLGRVREPHKMAALSTRIRTALETWIQDGGNDTSARRQAGASLGELFRDEDTRALLFRLAAQDEDPDGREVAIASIGAHFRDEITRAFLVGHIRDDEKALLRSHATAFIAEHFRDDASRTILVEIARRNDNTSARSQTVALLAEHFRDEDTRALLIELALRNEDTLARTQAFASLDKYFRDSPEVAEFLKPVNESGRSVVRVIPSDVIAATAAWLESAEAGRIDLRGLCTFGRTVDNTVRIDSPLVSRRHAMIHGQQADFWLVDLGSRNGTHLNGRRVIGPSRLADGDRIVIAKFYCIFRRSISANELGVDDFAEEKDTPRARCWLMVLDMANFTALSQKLDSHELAMLVGKLVRQCNDLIAEHGGTVNKFMGDGLLAFWRDSEGAAEQVAAALLALRNLSTGGRIEFRAAVHHAPVWLEIAQTTDEITLLGSGVVFAFRMERFAASLSIPFCLSEPARALLKPFLPTESIPGEHALKGFEGSQRFFRLL